MYYRKLPVVIEAQQFSEENGREVAIWCGGNYVQNAAVAKVINEEEVLGNDVIYYIEIPTLEGTMLAEPGDYIIKGVKGEFYPCKADIFEATYEIASDPIV